eukprot:8589964-Karenia_brevis.AAC.1
MWYLDDGTIVCAPHLVVPFLEAFDRRSAGVGAERNRMKTKVSFLADKHVIQMHGHVWQMHRMRELAEVTESPETVICLGAETWSPEAAVAQFEMQTDVVRKMMKKIALCQDSQVEFVLQRACLGVSK